MSLLSSSLGSVPEHPGSGRAERLGDVVDGGLLGRGDLDPVLAMRRGEFVRHAGRFWWRGLGGAALSGFAYAIVLWAMMRAPIAAVSALRETSVVFAALIGAWLLKEGHIARRLASALVVVAGVVALKL